MSLIDQNIVANQNSVILKPTAACNAACKFCYASKFGDKAKTTDYFDEQYKEYIEKHDVKNIILTGGEVTLLRNFLNETCDYCTDNNLSVSLVSNLIDMTKDRNYWSNFFKTYEKVHLTGSYQVDLSRKDLNSNKITQDDFLDFVKWYNNEIKKKLLVISVINYNNESTALENVYLAKEHGYIASLERQIKIGRADSEYLPLDYYKLLCKIIDLDLWQYEKHTAELVEKGLYNQRYCNFFCKNMIPVIYINKSGKLVETFCDQISTIDREPIEYIKTSALQRECLLCKNYNMCQGCHLTRMNLHEHFKTNNIDISTYCKNITEILKELEVKLLKIRGKI